MSHGVHLFRGFLFWHPPQPSKSLIWRLGSYIWNVRVADVESSCSDLSPKRYLETSLKNSHQATWTVCYTREIIIESLQWRHNERDSVSNHQTHDCLLKRLFRRRSKKTSKLRVTGLCVGNSPVTGEFPAQMTSYAENVSIWWRHHVYIISIWLLSRQPFFTCCNGPIVHVVPGIMIMDQVCWSLQIHIRLQQCQSTIWYDLTYATLATLANLAYII